MIFTPNFLPCIAYFKKILECETLNINSDDIYIKQTFRNRCQILGANKTENLIIPVHASSMKTPSQEVRVDNKMPWQRTHKRTLDAAYKRSPFYQFYDYLFLPLFEKKYDFLIDLQLDSLSYCLKCLQIERTFCQTSKKEEDELIDIKSKVLPSKYVFEPYLQNFGNEFVPNLSIVDVLFAKGPETVNYLTNQVRIEQ